MNINDTICLIIWIILGMFAIGHVLKNEPVHPLSYFCAVLTCILHYVQKLCV